MSLNKKKGDDLGVIIQKNKKNLSRFYRSSLMRQQELIFNLALKSTAAAFIILHSLLNIKEIQAYATDFLSHIPENSLIASAASSVLSGKIKPEVKVSRKGTNWILNGRKNICTGYIYADGYLVRAKFKSKNTLFYIPRKSKGLSIGNELKMLGLEKSTGEVIFKNVKLPLENIIGKMGKAEEVIKYDNYTGLHFGILALGATKRCLNETIGILKRRKIKNLSLIKKIKREIDTLWNLQKQNAKRLQQFISKNKQSEYVKRNTVLYKNMLCSASIDLIHILLTVIGKNGYIKSNLIGPLLCDVYGFYLTYPNIQSAYREGFTPFLPRNARNWSSDLAKASRRLGPRV